MRQQSPKEAPSVADGCDQLFDGLRRQGREKRKRSRPEPRSAETEVSAFVVVAPPVKHKAGEARRSEAQEDAQAPECTDFFAVIIAVRRILGRQDLEDECNKDTYQCRAWCRRRAGWAGRSPRVRFGAGPSSCRTFWSRSPAECDASRADPWLRCSL